MKSVFPIKYSKALKRCVFSPFYYSTDLINDKCHRELWFNFFCISIVTADPQYSAPILNVTVPVGREAILTCSVEALGSYKVSI